jgi:recombination protein RecR
MVGFFVLGGLLNPIEGVFKEDLPVGRLLNFVEKWRVEEVVFCFPYSFEGENTKEYLVKRVRSEYPSLRISSVGENLPKNTPVFYVEESMLERAIKNRRDV